jgi:hypothetical protein
MAINATPKTAVRHMFGQLQRNATQRERAERERIVAAFRVMMIHENRIHKPAAQQPTKRAVEGAYKFFNEGLAKRHPDVDFKWDRPRQ